VGAGIGALVGGLLGAPACLGVAVAHFLVQAVLILLSPAVRLRRQPQMAGENLGVTPAAAALRCS
jgi:hypothetical protein